MFISSMVLSSSMMNSGLWVGSVLFVIVMCFFVVRELVIVSIGMIVLKWLNYIVIVVI